VHECRNKTRVNPGRIRHMDRNNGV
jgi:hypothetical protein